MPTVIDEKHKFVNDSWHSGMGFWFIHLAKDRGVWCAVMHMVINLQLPKRVGIC
jgi:hypothetical protein